MTGLRAESRAEASTAGSDRTGGSSTLTLVRWLLDAQAAAPDCASVPLPSWPGLFRPSAAAAAAQLGKIAVKVLFSLQRRQSYNRLPSHQFDVLAAWMAGTSPAMTMEVAGRPNEVADRNASERQFLAQKRNLSYHLRMTSFPSSTIVRVRKVRTRRDRPHSTTRRRSKTGEKFYLNRA